MGMMDKVLAYRARETMPLRLDKGEVITTAAAAREGLKLGMPKVGAEQLANKILLEGRENAGTNEFNYNNSKAQKLHDDVAAQGIPSYAANYPAAVLDKSEVATRLNIPFELAWNGTGKLAANGSDGKRHAARAETMKDADKDPRNADFVDLIQRTLKNDNTGQEILMTRSPIDIVNSIMGPDSMRYTGDSYKISDKAANDFTSRVEAAMENLKYNDKQKAEARKVLTDYSYQSVGSLDQLYKQASGIDISKSRLSYTTEQINKSPVAQEVVNVLLGVDPEGQLYKAAYEKKNPKPAEEPSWLSKILGN